MIKINRIPETINIDKYSFARIHCEDDPGPQNIKNTPVSGITIERLCSLVEADIHDPRGFKCRILNLDQLLPHITINKGVIEEDLVYGIVSYRRDYWVLLTQEMVKNSFMPLTSVKDLKPGFVYKLSTDDSPAVYLGRLKWKEQLYCVSRPYHTFACPETRKIINKTSLLGREVLPLGYDDPDTYKDALDIFNQSWEGNDIHIESFDLAENIKISDGQYSDLREEFIDFLENKIKDFPARCFVRRRSNKTMDIFRLSAGMWYWDAGLERYTIKLYSGGIYIKDLSFITGSLDYLKSLITPDHCILLDVKDEFTRDAYNPYKWPQYGNLIECNMSDGSRKTLRQLYDEHEITYSINY